VDARFGVRRTSGRGGKVTVAFPAYTAHAEFEVGAAVDLTVYATTLAYASGDLVPQDRRALTLLSKPPQPNPSLQPTRYGWLRQPALLPECLDDFIAEDNRSLGRS